MGFVRKITLNILVSSMGRVLGGILALFSIGIITRSLGVAGFGEYSTVVAYLSTVQIFADMGLYSLLTREISQNPQREKELVSTFFTLRLILATLFLLFGSVLIFIFPYSGAVKMGVLLASSGFLFLSLSQIFLGVFQKHLAIYKAAISELLGRAVQLLLVWYFFISGKGFFYYLVAIVLSSFVIFILNMIFARRLVRFKLHISIAEFKRIIKSVLPIAISLIFTLLYFKSDILILSIIKSQEDVGVYGAAYKVLEIIIFFPAAFIGLMLPRLSKLAKENRKKFSDLFSSLFSIISMGAFPIVFGGLILAYSIVNLIGGKDFLASAAPLRVLFVAIGIIFFGTLFGSSIIALDLQKKAMWAYVYGFIFNIVANLVVIPRYSYMGASWSTLFTELLVTLYLFYILKKEIKIKIKNTVLFKTVLASLVMGALLFYISVPIQEPLSYFRLSGAILVGMAVYFSLFYILGLKKEAILID